LKYKDILNNFTEIEKLQTLTYIADETKVNEKETLMAIEGENNIRFKLNLNKIKNFCLKNIFQERNSSIKLSEFLSLFKYSLRLILPNELLEIENQNNTKYIEETTCEDNIFEYYREYDFRFMKNQTYIYFLKTQREPLIQYLIFMHFYLLHTFLNNSFQAIEEMPEKFEEVLKELYEKKERWTINELRPFLAEFKFSNLEEKLTKFCKIIPEPNPFDNRKSTNFFYLKMPIKI